MLKNLQARLQHYMNLEFPDVQAGLKKKKRQKNQRINFQHPLDHRKGKKIPKNKKTSISVSVTTLKPLTVWITTN